MNKKRLDSSLLHGGFQTSERMCVFNFELSHGDAPKTGEMGSAAEFLSHLVGNGADVGPGSYSRPESGVFATGTQNFKFFNLYLDGLKQDLLLLAREFVGRHSCNFLSRKRRRHLFDLSSKLCSHRTYFITIQVHILWRRDGLAVGVIGIRGKAEANRTFVYLFRMDVELGQAG